MSGNTSRLDVTERSFLSQSTSATDELDGFDDFDSEVSSTEDVASSCGAHSQPQKKSIKVGKAIKRLILPSILPSVRPHVHPCVFPTVGLSASAPSSDGAWAGLCLYVRLRGRPCGRVSVQACMHVSVFVDVCTGMHVSVPAGSYVGIRRHGCLDRKTLQPMQSPCSIILILHKFDHESLSFLIPL